LTALYVTSLAEGAGRTIICSGVARHLLSSGKKVGFFKPIITGEKEGSDALFMKQLLSLDEPLDDISPVIRGQDSMAGEVRKAYDKISPGKDVVIVEGACERSIIEALDAKVVIVEDYSKEPQTKPGSIGKDLEGYLLGVVLNKVPSSRLDSVAADPQFSEAGVTMLGVLPEDRLLFTLSVGELAGYLQGEILNGAEKSGELVENFMLGAMSVDPGPEYFGRKANKAVVVKGDRPDMQMAVLETSTRCLILSGGAAPIPAVQYKAKDRNIPLIVVKSDTMATVMAIEEALWFPVCIPGIGFSQLEIQMVVGV